MYYFTCILLSSLRKTHIKIIIKWNLWNIYTNVLCCSHERYAFGIVCVYRMINCKDHEKNSENKNFKDYQINNRYCSPLTSDWESSAVALLMHIFLFLKCCQLVILCSWSISFFFFGYCEIKCWKKSKIKKKIRSKWKKSYMKNYIWGWGGSQRLLKVIVFFKSINCIINHCSRA